MKIIVPTDFSETAASALRYGEFLANGLGYELEVVHAHDGYGHSEDPTVKKGDLAAKMNVQQKLDEFLRFNATPVPLNEAPENQTVLNLKHC